ncbi:hypothetical protein GGF46_004260 [Coemansia sp. RSA 552]|nr:hypothetical protein GGF46_004260 [Coemansia sp. RSA 552]
MEVQSLVGTFEPAQSCTAAYEVGIVRLYRGKAERPGYVHVEKPPENGPAASSSSNPSGPGGTPAHVDQTSRSRILAVLAVPGYMTPTDFLSFAGPFGDSIESVRVVRDGSPNHYMILIRFRSSEKADEFHAYYNGKTFSPLEPETCNVVYVGQVICESVGMDPADFDQEQGAVRETPAAMFLMPSGQLRDDMGQELPTCPVCLERLDSAVSGLMTTFCQHMFHCRCLLRWGDGNCPVCRYSQASALVDQGRFQQVIGSSERVVPPPMAARGPEDGHLLVPSPGTSGASKCHSCQGTDDLWICLICGTIGCGRYTKGHAKDHFEQTQHPYSMELESQCVWDYAGDGYVHRLLQNEADRKVIAFDSHSSGGAEPDSARYEPNRSASYPGDDHPGAARTTTGNGGPRSSVKGRRTAQEHQPGCCQESFVDAHEKLVAVSQEYELLLTSQLESQRDHYEMQISRLRHQQAMQTRRQTELEHGANELRQRCVELERKQAGHEATRELEQKLARVGEERREWLGERQRLEASANRWLKKSTEDARLLLEEKALSRQLEENQGALKAQISECQASMVDLQEQVRDLTFFITTQKTLAKENNEDSEVHGASIVGVAEPPVSPQRGRGRGKRRLPRK